MSYKKGCPNKRNNTGGRAVAANIRRITHAEHKSRLVFSPINYPRLRTHPQRQVLVHPEAPADAVALADAIGSTLALLKAARDAT